MERQKFIPLVMLGLTVAEVASGCSYRSEKVDKEAKDLLNTGKSTTFIVDEVSGVIENGGLNVRQFPGNTQDQEANANTIIGKIPAGTVILNAVKLNDKWAAADCANVFNDPKSDKKGQICYFDYRDYATEQKAPQE